jgi:hypothetical protein
LSTGKCRLLAEDDGARKSENLCGLPSVSAYRNFDISAANQVEKQADGVRVQIPGYLLRVQVMSDSVVRIAAAKDKQFFSRSSMDVLPHTAMTQGWKLASTSASVTISTSKVQVRVDRANGAVTFLDASGKTILAESEGGRAIEAANVQARMPFMSAKAGNPLQMSRSMDSGSSSWGSWTSRATISTCGSTTLMLWFRFWFEQGLRNSLGQHLLHTLRRSEAVRTGAGGKLAGWARCIWRADGATG